MLDHLPAGWHDRVVVSRAAVRGEVVHVGLVGRVLGLEVDLEVELEVRVVLGDGAAETAGDGVAGAGGFDHVGAEDEGGEGGEGVLEGGEVPGGTGGGEFLGEGMHFVYYGRRR